MPEDPLTQKECDLRFSPLFDLPRFRQLSNEVLEVSVIFDQTVKNKTVNIAGGGILGKNWIEIGSITDGAHHQLVDFLEWSGADKNDIDREKDEKENRGDKKNRLDLQKRFPFNGLFFKIL
jgi:hypothetical protein